MPNTCITHRRNIKTRYVGSTSILLWGKGWSSIRLDRTQSIFTKHFQLIVFRKLLGWKLEQSYTRRFSCHLGFHQRSPWNTTWKENWVQNMLNDHKLGNYLGVSSQTNQIQTQIMMIERWQQLFAVTQVTRKVQGKRPVLRRSKHVLFVKKLKITIERGHPLSPVAQITRQEPPKHVHQMTARASTLKRVTCMVNLDWRSELCPWTKTILTPGSEFLTNQTSFVVNLNNYEQEIPEVRLEEYALKFDAKDFASRSKAKAKPQRRDSASSSTRTIPIGERT